MLERCLRSLKFRKLNFDRELFYSFGTIFDDKFQFSVDISSHGKFLLTLCLHSLKKVRGSSGEEK